MLTLIIFFYSVAVNSVELLRSEPDIQCTIIKVHQKGKLAGVKEFPRLYQTINNDPATSRFFIAGIELVDANPKTISKTAQSETISVKTSTASIVLELKGKPISRNGSLNVNGKNLAEVTCH